MVPVYKFGNNLIDADEIVFSDELITVPGFKKGISLKRENIYKDMT
jgi:hypothetical protein